MKVNNGKVECGEFFCLRYIPVIGHRSTDWVNDNNQRIFYHFSGNFTFKSQEEAAAALSKLVSTVTSLFFSSSKKSFPLYVSGAKLYFDDKGECPRFSLNDTDILIREVGRTALRGKVEAAFSVFERMDIYG